MKKALFFLMIIVTFLSCSNDNDNSTNQIVGQWKLIKSEHYGGNNLGGVGLQTTDYSDKNIIYNFKSNNKLLITGGNDIDITNSELNYIFENDYLSGFPSEGESKMSLVKIDCSKWTYSLTNGIMKLGQSYIDGADLYFERK